MSSYDNRHFIPQFSKEFEELHGRWKTHMSALKHISHNSAFNMHADGRTFQSGKTVISFTEILDALQSFLTFLRDHVDDFTAEAHRYLAEHRGFLWFYYAMNALYHPSDVDRQTFAMFFEGSWGDYDLSYDAYIADKERKEARGKTKNPNYVDTHVCCTNCICFYDDTPDYEWSKEDREESEASHNIRINWSKKKAFEREILTSGMLETWRPLWETWTPTQRPNSRSLTMDPFWWNQLNTATSVATKYVDQIWFYFPMELYFSFLWDNQDRFPVLIAEIEAELRKLRARYETTREWEDEVVEDARSNVKNIPVRKCYFEDETCYYT